MSGKRPTVYDIAERASTSVSTVSRVLNGSTLIPAATRKSVLAAADQLGYEGRKTRRPAGRSVLNIVVFLPNTGAPESHLFYDVAELFHGVYEGLGETRAHIIAALNGSDSPFEGKKLGDIDGCIFAFGEPDQKAIELLSDRKIPFVLVNRTDERFAYVANDAAAGFSGLAGMLAERASAVKPAFLTYAPTRPVMRLRAHAIATCGYAPLEHADHHMLPAPEQLTASDVEGVLAAGYDALFCVNDLLAVAVYERLLRLGLRVPRDVALAGYDAAPIRKLITPELTTVDLASREQGRSGAEILTAAILERSQPIGRKLVPGALIRGETL
ncbi:MAG: LacI family DNA-binding transcriptional regulator [Spirochaetales bacterium]